MDFTSEQQSAIDARGCELLVSAAAGSGKTAVLVERIIKLIIKDNHDIDKLLIVTFTDAAANEMRCRISDKLLSLQMCTPDDENIRRQLMLLPRAQISTIHKFCAGIIRRYFHLSELDSSFKVADETEAGLLKNQVLDEIFEEHYETGDSFFDLVDYYGGGKTKDHELRELVLRISVFMSGFPWPDQWIRRSCEMYGNTGGRFFCLEGHETEEPPPCPAWVEVLRCELLNRLAGAADSVEYGMKLAALGANKYLGALEADMEMIDLLRSKLDDLAYFREELYAIKFKDLKRFSAKDDFDPEIKECVQNLRNREIKPAIKDLQKLFVKPIPDMERDIRELHHIIKALTELVTEFNMRYSEAKRHRNIADFNDLEQYALKILLLPGPDKSNHVLSDAALELREHYAEVMIDEYQDSNLVQELILSAVSERSRFMVGDVKQSIYKFRGAKPELFMEKMDKRAVRHVDGPPVSLSLRQGDRPHASLITLSKNFRSRKCVIDAVNLVFSRLMTVAGEIDYDDNAMLYYGADFPDAGGLPVSDDTELYVIDGEDEPDLSRIELEALTIAHRINELVGSMYVYDREEKSYRRVMYKDIAILLRSVRGVAETFLDVLKRSGIPVFADSATGYFDSVEVMTMLSFLQIIDNPRQDIPLLAVLRSPVYGLTDDELLAIRLDNNNHFTFYDSIKEMCQGPPLAQKLEKFLLDLENFRRESIYLSISVLIDYIYTTTDYFNYAGAMTGGAVRQANLRLLREKAVLYEQTSYRGLFHFIAYMQKVKERSNEGSAKAVSENANIVRIMTVHKSKGLEFPIVFVSMLGRGFSGQDERRNVILHSELGIGTVHIDLDRRIKSNTLPRMAAVIQLRRESMAEELRVLYVAFTRAREKLILTGSVSSLTKARDRWQRHEIDGEMPAHMIFGANCCLDWLMPVICSGKNEGAAGVKVYYRGCSRQYHGPSVSNGAIQEKPPLVSPPAVIHPGVEVRGKLEWSYPLKEIAQLPAKLSISEIKRLYNRGQDEAGEQFFSPAPFESEGPPPCLIPGFLEGKTGPAPAGKGTVMHTVLEHMDMRRLNNTNDLITLVSSLVERRILTRYEAGMVDYPALYKFCRSDICRRAIAAMPCVWRETPFVIGLTPYQIYKKPEFMGIDASILVHGIIDCYFEENGRLVLVDYKTGKKSTPDEYSLQMAMYKLALERATGKEIGECLLYMFAEGRIVKARLAEI